MLQPQESRLAIEATPEYHYVNRCVRCACLSGKDKFKPIYLADISNGMLRWDRTNISAALLSTSRSGSE